MKARGLVLYGPHGISLCSLASKLPTSLQTDPGTMSGMSKDLLPVSRIESGSIVVC